MIYPHFVKMSQEDGNKDIVFLKIFGEVSQETRVRSLASPLHPHNPCRPERLQPDFLL